MAVATQHIPKDFVQLLSNRVTYAPSQTILNISWSFAVHFEGAENLEIVNMANNKTFGRLAHIRNGNAHFLEYQEGKTCFRNYPLGYMEKKYWLRLTCKDPKQASTSQFLNVFDFATKLPKMVSILERFINPKGADSKEQCGVIMVPVLFSDSEGIACRPVYWFYDKDYKKEVTPQITKVLSEAGIPHVVK